MKHKRFQQLILGWLVLITLISGSAAPLHATPQAKPLTLPPTERGLPLSLNELDIPRQWIQLLQEQVDRQGLDLPNSARITAYLMVALYEVTLPEMAGASSLATRLPGLPALPKRKGGLAYDPPAVAIGAMAKITEELLRSALPTAAAQAAALRSINSLRTTQTRLRAQRRPADTMTRSLTLGSAIGDAIATWAAADGLSLLHNRTFVLPTGDNSYWQPTASTQTPLQPFWGTLPGLLPAMAVNCAAPLRLTFSTAAGSTFHHQAMEVYHFVKEMTPTERQIVDFWSYGQTSAGESNTGLSIGNAVTRWFLIADQVATARELSLTEAAALYAPLGMALHETTIVTWRTQYQHFLLRPESYIHEWIDKSWHPDQPTPNSPAYPATDAAIGTAAAAVLTAKLGLLPFVDQTRRTDDRSRGRRFTTFAAAAYEQGMAALYAGTTFRAAVEAGLEQGACVGRQVSEQLSTTAETRDEP